MLALKEKSMKYLATFESHFAALACAQACAQKKWPVRLAPVPRSLSSGCGTCAYYEGEEKFFYPGPLPEGVESIYKIEGEKYHLIYDRDEHEET